MLIQYALRYPEGKFPTDILPMVMYYAVWMYNIIPGMQSGIYPIEI